MLAEHYLQQLHNNYWFAQLDPDARQFILQHAQVLHYDKEQLVFAAGDAYDGIYAILEGSVRIAHIDLQGQEAVTLIAEPIMWFGEISLIDRQPRSHHTITAKKSVLLRLNTHDLNQYLQQQPSFWFHIAQLTSQKLRFAFLELVSLQIQSISQRLAQRLLFILSGYGNHIATDNYIIHLSQEQLAQMLVCSRQTINQELQTMEKLGVIQVSFKKIEVLDRNKLQQLAHQS